MFILKKLLSVLSIITIIFASFSTIAYANDSWETDPIDIEISDTNEKTTIAVSKCSISNIKSKTYTSNKLYQSPVVKYNNKTLVKGTDYTLSYKNNIKVGTATVTIKGIGNYSGAVAKTFKINPKGTSLSSVSSPKKAQLKVSWKKQSTQTTGYQIRYSTTKEFKKYTTKTVSSTKTTSRTFKSLKGKKYYVKVRTYKTVDGKKYYSSWSSVKSTSIK